MQICQLIAFHMYIRAKQIRWQQANDEMWLDDRNVTSLARIQMQKSIKSYKRPKNF
jgi:hypothetical protein